MTTRGIKFENNSYYQVNAKVDGRTALHCAAAIGNLQQMKLLLEFGAGIEIEVSYLNGWCISFISVISLYLFQDNRNNRALHYSCMM